jgi:isopenicillin N synthase-like dioxygenase
LQFYAKGHGVPSEMMDKTFEWAERFFELSFDEKMELFINNQDNYRGYTPMYGSGKPDIDGLASEYYKLYTSVYNAVMVD